MEGIELARLRDRLNLEVKNGEESNLTPLRGKELNVTFGEVTCDSLLFVSYGVLFFSVPRNSENKEILEVEK